MLNARQPQDVYKRQVNGRLRPEQYTNEWVPAADDSLPTVTWRWEQPQTLHALTLVFDNDFDNAMERCV